MSCTEILPTLFDGLFVVSCGRDEKETTQRPQFFDKIDASLHQPDHADDAFHWRLDAVVAQDVGEGRRQFFVVAVQNIFVVKPLPFDVIKLCAGFRTFRQVEKSDEVVHTQQLLVVARIPAEQGQEIHHRFRQVAALAIARRSLARFWVCPFQREDGKAQTVAVPFRKFPFPIRL